jgi:hypothetical protein
MVLVLAGLFAGIVDAVAGGGGLITLPALMLQVGAGAHAIGSNKIPGFVAAFAALLVYAKRGHLEWRSGARFSVAISIGAFAGSLASPHLPLAAFRVLLWVTAPLVLGFVFLGKELFERAVDHRSAERSSVPRLFVLGGVIGFYDGAWGPGGGTFMVLGLLVGTKMPVLGALATAKLANSCSALFSGLGYWTAGRVDVHAGLRVAAGALVGATLGARLASQFTAKMVRPALALVSILLIWRVWNA